jgi:hypothetical protein
LSSLSLFSLLSLYSLYFIYKRYTLKVWRKEIQEERKELEGS